MDMAWRNDALIDLMVAIVWVGFFCFRKRLLFLCEDGHHTSLLLPLPLKLIVAIVVNRTKICARRKCNRDLHTT